MKFMTVPFVSFDLSRDKVIEMYNCDWKYIDITLTLQCIYVYKMNL